MELFLLTSMQYSLLRIDEYVCVQKSTAKYMGSVSDGRNQVERDRGDRSGGGWGGDSRATLGLHQHSLMSPFFAVWCSCIAASDMLLVRKSDWYVWMS